MASGTIKMKSPKHWAGELIWESKSQPEKNSSSVEVSCYTWRTDGGESYGSSPYWGQIFLGTEKKPFKFGRINGNRQFVGSCWAEIPHDKDGNAQVEIRAIIYGSHKNDLSGSTLEGGETVTLDPISQAGPSPITLNAASIQMGKKLIISLTPDKQECTHELRYRFLEASGVIGEKISKSCQWTVPDLSAYCGLSGTCTITCRTFLGEKNLGTSEASLTLTVPDPTKAVLKEASLGVSSQVQCHKNAENFSLEVSLILKGREYAVWKGRENAFFWTPPYELARQCPDLREFSGLLRCKTINGSETVGTLESPILLKVPQNVFTQPRILYLNLSPVTGDLPEKFGYIRGVTGLKASFEAESDCSQVAEYSLKAGSAQGVGNPAVIPVLEDSGKVKITATVKDLRGYQSTIIREIQVSAYEKPRVVPLSGENKVICQRAEASGALSSKGTFLSIRAGMRCSPLKSGEENLNTCSLSYRWRRGEEPFGRWISLLTGEKTEISTLIENVVPSLKHSYQVQLKAEDTLQQETVLTFPILTEAVSFALYDGTDGASFGKYPEKPHVVDVAEHMTLLVRGKLELRGETWQDLGLAPGILPPVTPHGPLEGAKLRVSGGNHVYLACSCQMPKADHAVNETPVPGALLPGGEVLSLSPCEDGLVLLRLGTDGFLRISPLWGRGDPGWIDGSLDYFL